MILELYERLLAQFGSRADPDVWWPIYRSRSVPPAFERAITNILVQHSSWRAVQSAVAALDQAGLLTASGLVNASPALLAECVKPTGLQAQKAARLHDFGSFVVRQYATELAFCTQVSRDELLAFPGIGIPTADRMLLYVCNRLVWPVDAYCLRVLAHEGIIAAVPTRPAEERRVVAAIKALVERELPHDVLIWQRFHALMQLKGETVRPPRQRGVQDPPPAA